MHLFLYALKCLCFFLSKLVKMKKYSKRYKECLKEVDSSKTCNVVEAVNILKGLQKPKFDESVEIALKLGIDPKRSDQLVRGAISLPNGIGKTLRVIVFATGDNIELAKAAGAVEAGEAELIKKVQEGWQDFDVAVSTPELMSKVGKLGKVLGPQGKMPSPKSGTVTTAVEKTVKEFMAGKIEFKTDAGGNVHGLMGKLSFAVDDLVGNINAFIAHISTLKPAAAKGTFLMKGSLASTMSPGISITV